MVLPESDVKGILGFVTEPARNETQTLSTTSATIAEQRIALQPRKLIVVRNLADPVTDPTNVVTVNMGGSPAVANEGIVLRAGESFADSTSEGYQAWQGVITAIAAAGTPTISIFER